MRGKVFFWDHRFFFHFGAKSVKKGFAVNVAWVCVVVLCFIFRIVQVLFDWSLGCCVMFVLGGSCVHLNMYVSKSGLIGTRVLVSH